MTSEYTAIIPAAGKGVRLMPYTEHLPKTMLPVAGRPILGHILEQILSCGIEKVVFIVGYQKDAIIDYVANQYPQLKAVFVEQHEAKGLGHAIYLAKNYVQGPCFILLGDTIVEGELPPFVAGNINALGVKYVEDPRRFGVVELQDEKIVGLEEKPEHPKSNLAIIGAYSFKDSKQLFTALERLIHSGKTVKNEIQLTDALDVMLENGVALTPVFVDDWFDCGTVDMLLSTNRILLNRCKKVPAKFTKNNKIIPPCYIDENATVSDCAVGPFVSISAGAKLAACSVEDAIVFGNVVLEKRKIYHEMIDEHGL